MSPPARRSASARAALLAAVVALAGAAPAGADVTWVVKGRGFGHGVGMSQYGAYGYAIEGRGYRDILRHYYRGTRIVKLGRPAVVRVLIDIDKGDVGFSGARSACGRNLDPGRRYEAHRKGDSVRLRTAAGRSLANCRGKLRAAGGKAVRIRGEPYRGALEVVPTGRNAGALNVINAVSVNQYVKGVIPNEMPASWPQAALRVQAVAGRAYALSSGVGGNGFDLYDDTRSAVYEGMASETAATNRAASATSGEVVAHRGEVAQAFYSACSGGHTESVENVFYGPPVPYLRGVPDPFDRHCPLHTWRLTFSGAEIAAKLGGHLRGRLRRIVVTERGDSPRIVWARLHGTRGVTKIRGDQLQYALGAYDRWMSFRRIPSRGS